MGEVRRIDELYAEVGAKLIETMPLLAKVKEAAPGIIYLASNAKKKTKGKNVLGECERVQSKNKWAIPAEYEIIIYEPNITGITENQLKVLIYHELLHIEITYSNGDTVFGTKAHDVGEFKDIIERYGVDWAKGIGGPEEKNKDGAKIESKQQDKEQGDDEINNT